MQLELNYENNKGTGSCRDIISLISAMVLLVAGFDTTSMTLSCMVYHLSKAWLTHSNTTLVKHKMKD
jgi:hypothetical protein